MLGAPYTEFEVNHNLVQRDATPSTQTSNGAWSALVAGGVGSENGTWRAGDLSAIRVDSTRTLVLRGTRAYLAVLTDTPAGATVSEPPLPRGSVLGNVFNARGTTPVVNVSAAGECLFNDNRVEARLNTGGMAVILATNVAIVNANRVRGGETSIQVTGATIKTAAVLGNITTGRIAIMGGALPNPWHDLNLIG